MRRGHLIDSASLKPPEIVLRNRIVPFFKASRFANSRELMEDTDIRSNNLATTIRSQEKTQPRQL